VVGTSFWDPAHVVMERRMLPTIKRLAEQSSSMVNNPREIEARKSAIAYEYITFRSPFTIRPTL
jgi:hypothetical protein